MPLWSAEVVILPKTGRHGYQKHGIMILKGELGLLMFLREFNDSEIKIVSNLLFKLRSVEVNLMEEVKVIWKLTKDKRFSDKSLRRKLRE